ncbi:MAG TPA: YggS family pyridoxal phosphate-dependent enzyme [Rectinemataceae bacterium]|nr:YggS family pyridoxal phosphate-dependent enzyme [Rectinemataceae bacterium]
MDIDSAARYETYLERVGTGLVSLRDRVAEACRRASRSPDGVEIVAVSKFHPAEAVEAAIACGIDRFAESRVQEAEEKFAIVGEKRSRPRLDLIGHLQGNKAKRALLLFDRIQSIDSIELLETLVGRMACRAEGNRPLPIEILFELHTAEDSKGGFPDGDAVRRACDFMAGLPPDSALIPRGLMTMAPLGRDEGAIRSSFAMLRSLRAAIASEYAFTGFDVLSMGMSGDFELAVEEGATEIRIGTALFGERLA